MKQVLEFPQWNVKKNSLQSLLYSLHFLDYHTPEVSFTQVLSNTHQTKNIKYHAPVFVVYMVVLASWKAGDICDRESLGRALSCLDSLPSSTLQKLNARYWWHCFWPSSNKTPTLNISEWNLPLWNAEAPNLQSFWSDRQHFSQCQGKHCIDTWLTCSFWAKQTNKNYECYVRWQTDCTALDSALASRVYLAGDNHHHCQYEEYTIDKIQISFKFLFHQKCSCSQLSSPLSMRIVMFSRVSQKSRIHKPIQLRYKLELGLRTV